MDIYIRTQNKEQLIKIQKDITITDAKKYKKMFNIIDVDVMSSEYDKVDGIDIIREIASVEGYLLTTDKLLLGTYKSKERALEVLDEIQNKIKGIYLLKPETLVNTSTIEQAKDYYEKLNNIDIITYDNNFTILPINSNVIVYEMSEE